MAYFRRRFRYRVRRPWRVRRMYRRRGYSRKYVNASSRSTIRMKCTQTYSSYKTSGHGTTLGNVTAIAPYAAANDMAVVNNPLYQAYCNLYEETKMIGMKAQLNVTSVVGNATLPSLQIYTCWDRRFGYLEPAPTAANIRAAATTNVSTALNNNVAKISRSIYASDLMEKAQWHDSSYDATGDQAWQAAGLNPNFFCPAFLFCFGSPSLAADTNVNYSLSVTYYVAFRNPKYGGSANAKDLPSRDITFPDDGDDSDMDDGGGAAAVPSSTLDLEMDSSVPPPTLSANARQASDTARRAQSAYEKRTRKTIVVDPTRGGSKNA